jgi:hypothetical protein
LLLGIFPYQRGFLPCDTGRIGIAFLDDYFVEVVAIVIVMGLIDDAGSAVTHYIINPIASGTTGNGEDQLIIQF